MQTCGKLITFEGPEGSGKSTHAADLARRLEAAGHLVTVTREPGGTWMGEAVRELLKTRRRPAPAATTELFLFLACRAQLAGEIIMPALRAGRHVICDRFTDSTIAYQGYGRGGDPRRLSELNRLATDGLAPDLTFLLDLDVNVGLERARRRARADGADADRIEHEARDFHERVRRGYLALAAAEPGRFHVLNAEQPPAEVAAAIWSTVALVIKQ